MVKNPENFTSDLEQPDLFQTLAQVPEYLADNAPDLDIEQEFLGALKFNRRMAKRHGVTKAEQIVDRMNLCLPENLHITVRQLNGWTAESAEYRHFPAIYLPAYIWATRGILMPIEVLTGSLGLAVLDEREQDAVELGRAALDKAKAAKRERTLRNKLRI